jgi:hypothetical protein
MNAPIITCQGCATQPATICHQCVEHRNSAPAGQCPDPVYCQWCAAIHPLVASCVDDLEALEAGRGHRGLDETDFDIWATESAFGAPRGELAIMTGWRQGWQVDSGTTWPVPDWV